MPEELIVIVMNQLLNVVVDDDGQVSIATDYGFSAEERRYGKFDRSNPLYVSLVDGLRGSDADCQYLIRMLENARKEARYPHPRLHPALEDALLEWRKQTAVAAGVPTYYVLHQRVLYGIADLAPQTTEELLSVPGFGPGLYDRYGEEILSLVQEF